MADYIRREALIQHLEACKNGVAVTNLVWASIMAIECYVRDMPAADVAEVVYCKDCKMWEKQNIFEHSDTGSMRRGGYCQCSRFTRYEDDFCSFGEYRTNTGDPAHE